MTHNIVILYSGNDNRHFLGFYDHPDQANNCRELFLGFVHGLTAQDISNSEVYQEIKKQMGECKRLLTGDELSDLIQTYTVVRGRV